MSNPIFTWTRGEGGRHVRNPILDSNWSQVRYELAAVPLVETVLAGKMVEDWSGCRSPSRAMRRVRQGHKQHNKMVFKPGSFEIGGVIYAHPEVVKAVCALLNKRSDEMMRDVILNGVCP